MSLNDNKRLIERLYADGINRQDAAAAAAFYAEDAKNHGQTVGRAGMQKVFAALFAAFPDLNYRIVESTAEGDRVVCKVVMTATHRGQPTLRRAFSGMLADAAPTDRQVEVLHFHSFRIADGAIAEHAAVRDDLEMMFQLGLVRRPG
ncbi:MAG TPA: ester cyclase [Xanthobacteraceae bacterium]|jgi:predicted ester cyclase